MRLETQGQGRVKEEAETGAMGLQAKDRQGWHAPPLKPGGRCALDFPLESLEGTNPAHALTLGRKIEENRAWWGETAVSITSPVEGKSADGGALSWHNHGSSFWN